MSLKSAVIPSALILFGCAAVNSARADNQQTDWKFSFGLGTPAAGFTQVRPNDTYNAEKGFGFEPGNTPMEGSRTKEPLGYVASDKPFYFSAAVPEGNYDVTVTLGGAKEASTTTVKAELRRLMLDNIHTDADQTVQRTFTVNIRVPEIAGGGKVSLKPREKTTERMDWDDKLTLEFNGEHPAVCDLTITKVDVPTVYILGDSTVCDQPTEPWTSWGQMLPRFFKPGVAIANHAESGESLRSSLHAHRLDKVLSLMKPGDYLLVQYGHNDMKEKGPGVGAFTTYTDDLKKFVDGARSKGGIPVLITSMNRKSMDADGHITNTLGDYPEAVRRVAKEEHVALIDLNAMSKTLYEAIGAKDLDKAFAAPIVNGKVHQDGTHHDAYGAYELAQCIVDGIQQNKLGLVKFIVDDWKPFDPAHPDAIGSLKIPPSPAYSTEKPLGN